MVKNNANQTRLSLPGRALLLAAFFISGAASLIFEVIWTRILLISIGATAVAVGAVLGAFMAGMAVGSFLAGRDFLSRRSPVFTYAILEGWIGIYGLLTPYLLRLTAAASPLIQFSFAVIVLLPATIAMGASLPILSRAFGRGSKWKAVEVGRLYAANTAGAFAGPLLAVFCLFPAFGLRRALLIAAAADLLVFAGLLLSRKLFPGQVITKTVKAKLSSLQFDRPKVLLLVAMAVSGTAAMVYEVAWARTLSIVYGSSVYGTSIMLSTFLLGITLGAALASLLLRFRRRSVTLTAPALLLAGSAASAYLSLFTARQLPYLFVNIYNPSPGQDPALFFTQFLLALLLMLPTTLCLGAMLPVTTSLFSATSKAELGRQVSWLYTANLVGSAAGPVIAAGLLMGNFGIDLSVRGASVMVLLTALLLTAIKRRTRSSLTGIAAFAGAILLVIIINPKGQPVAKGYGFYNDPGYYQRNTSELKQIVAAHKLLYYRDGPTATVCVHQVGRYLVLKINGKNEGSNGPKDLETNLFLGHLPLLAADAKQVAIIGLGSGLTAGAVLTHPVEKVDVFEIEPAVVEASSHFDSFTGKPLEDPRLRLIMGDARSQLQGSGEIYDLIISEPSNPWITGVANLFTRDFFTLTASRLKKDGILCQWFHLYGMTEASTRSLVATLRSVFPHTLVFKYTDLIVLGSRSPIRFDIRRLQQVFQQPHIRESFSPTFVRYPFDLLIHLGLDEKGVATFSKGAAINTDDNLLIELAAPKSLYLDLDRIDDIRNGMDKHSHSLIDHMSGYPSPAVVHLEMAAAHFRAGDKGKALRMIRETLAKEDSFHGRRMLGQVLQSLGRREEAREAFVKALSLAADEQSRQYIEALIRALGNNPPGRN